MKGYDIGPNEEIRTFTWGEDATIGTKAVLLHHVFVPHRVADINVGPKWKCHHRRVKVNDIYMFLNKDFFTSKWILVIEPEIKCVNRDCIPYGAGMGQRVFASNWRVSKLLGIRNSYCEMSTSMWVWLYFSLSFYEFIQFLHLCDKYWVWLCNMICNGEACIRLGIDTQ